MSIHGWNPVDVLPVTDEEGESGYLMLLCSESAAPVVGYYKVGYLECTGEWVAASGGSRNLRVRWWKPLDPVPASILPPSQIRWALGTGLAFNDLKGALNEQSTD